MHSTYLDLDIEQEWLGDIFLEDAEHLKETNPDAYKNEYLGEANGNGGNVFKYIEERTITDEEISHMDKVYQGCDWGFFPDPYAFIRLYYNHNTEEIYLIDEIYENKWGNRKSADEILKRKYNDYTITCDSAEPKSINDYRDFGLPARAQ